MPGGDRTGPLGVGPMTGRAAGYCAGNPAPGYAYAGSGRGYGGGRGRGGGRGWRNRYYATGLTGWQRAAWGGPAWGAGWGYGAAVAPPPVPPASREQEIDLLRRQAEGLGRTLDEINARIADLQGEPQDG
jgi:hypothetical protein